MSGIDDLTHAELRALLNYDAETGVFVWVTPPRPRKMSRPTAGTSGAGGYIQLVVRQRRYYAHRLAFFYANARWPEGLIDHIDGNRQNNALSNLREVTHAMNSQNMRRAQAHNRTASHIGVSKRSDNGRYRATIRAGGRQINLGSFDTEEQAAAVYVAAKRRLHPGCAI